MMPSVISDVNRNCLLGKELLMWVPSQCEEGYVVEECQQKWQSKIGNDKTYVCIFS